MTSAAGTAGGNGAPVRRVLVLMNPGAGRRSVLHTTRRRLQQHGDPQVELLIPDPSDQTEQLAQAQAAVGQGVDAVVVCGGDGMVSLGAHLVARQGVPLGIVPTGSGNDFARACGIPRRYTAALNRVLEALKQPELPVRGVDALRLTLFCAESGATLSGPKWVANSVNIGFDAQVNQRANAQRRVPRKLRYLTALVREVPHFHAEEFVLQAEAGVAERHASSLVCIQNGSSIGGGIPLAPTARVDDGWAEVSHIEPLSRAGLVALFPLLMLRMHRLLRPLTTRRVRHLRVEVPGQVPVFADGDELHSGHGAGAAGVVVEVELIPGALLLL